MMEHIQAILLKSSVALAAFLLVYYTLLRKTSDFNIHRAFLMVGLGLAIVLPFVNITYPVYVQMETPEYVEIATDAGVETIEVVTPDIIPVEKTDWSNILFWIYCVVSSLFIIRLMISVIFGIRLSYKAKKVKWRNIYLYIHSSVNNPMVFGNRIFVKDSTYLQPEKEQVLIHEQIHQQQRHWVDMLMSELLLAMAWFNPLAYLYRKTVLNNLEYIADRGVLNTGLQLNAYIQSILCETMGAETIVLANHFRTSQNKQRLKMMKNVKQSKYGKWKLLTILPLLGIMLWAFSEPEYIDRAAISQGASIDRTELVKGVVYVEDTMEVRMKDGTYQQQIIMSPLPGTSIIVKGTTLGTVADKDGKFEIEVGKGDVLVFSFVGYKTTEVFPVKGKSLDVALLPKTHLLDPSKYKKRKKSAKPTPPTKVDGKPLFYVVEEMPSYVGGMDLYYEKLGELISREKKTAKLSGTVKVQFQVNAKGEVKFVSPLNRMDEVESEKAVKIVSELKDWKPGKQRGKNVSCYFTVHVMFDE